MGERFGEAKEHKAWTVEYADNGFEDVTRGDETDGTFSF